MEPRWYHCRKYFYLIVIWWPPDNIWWPPDKNIFCGGTTGALYATVSVRDDLDTDHINTILNHIQNY